MNDRIARVREEPKNSSTRQCFFRLRPMLMVAISIAFIMLLLLNRQMLAGVESISYAGVFVLTLLGASGAITGGLSGAVPGLAITFVAGSVLNPLKVGLIGGVGAGLGTCFSYSLGATGGAFVGGWRVTAIARSVLERHGSLALLITATLPNPVFDLIAVTAGMSGYPFARYLIIVLTGRTIRALVASYLGAYLGAQSLELF